MAGFLTNSGLAKLAVATPLTPMTVKYMAFDAGQGTPTPTMNALFNEVYRTEIPNPVKDPDQPKNLTFSGFVPTTVGGWTVYGVGLFDSLNVLVAYLQLAEPVMKSDPSSALKMSWQQDFIIALANAGETDLIVTDSVEFRHDAITNRDLPDSHPISAITGLQGALDNQIVHNNLSGRNIADAHPISAISGLETNLADKDTSINLDRKYKKITGNYTVLNNDGGLIEIDASAGNIVITMAKSTSHIPKKITLLRVDASSNTVTINPASGDSFNGEGFSYPAGNVSRFEALVFIAGVNYWTGVRSPSTGISNRGNNLQIVDKGVAIGQPILKSEVVNNVVSVNADLPLSAAQGKVLADRDAGIDQEYQDVTASRVAGTEYTNNTVKPIQVMIQITSGTSSTGNTIVVGGRIAASFSTHTSWSASYTFMVPPGKKYTLNTAAEIKFWSELR